MKILILSQVYWPDTASTAQHLADLAGELAAQGHPVEVLASSRLYETPREKLPGRETHLGVGITRLRQTWFRKASVAGRLLNFASFNASLLWRLLWLRRDAAEVVLGMTSPPLVSFLGVLMARLKGWRFVYWAMDLQPELAIQAGMLKAGSLPVRVLEAMGNQVFRHAVRTVALDRYMARHILSRGAAADSVTVLPVWPVAEEEAWPGPRLENPFRVANGFGDRVVVMYSGNHAVVHPLETLLEAALALRGDDRVLFVFVGGGVRAAEVTAFKNRHALANVIQLPYQPRNQIHISLAAADLHVVVMGDGQVGFTHPNKVYGAMYLGRPFLYIGPDPSHVTDLLAACPGNLSARHGEAAAVAAQLSAFILAGEADWRETGNRNKEHTRRFLAPGPLRRQMAEAVASC